MRRSILKSSALVFCIAISVFCNAQQVRIVPKIKPDLNFMLLALSPSGQYIATRTLQGNSISVFESFSGKELNRFPTYYRAENFFYLDERHLLVVFPFSVNIIDLRQNKSIREWKSDDMTGSSAFNFKNKILAITTSNHIIALDCKNLELNQLSVLPSKTAKNLSLSVDGSVLAGLLDGKIHCWKTDGFKLLGSIDAGNVKAFEAASDFLVTFRKDATAYQYYNFDGSARPGGKEIQNIADPLYPRLKWVGNGFFLETYKRIIFIDEQGYETHVKTDEYFKGMQFDTVNSMIVTMGFDHITVMDTEGAIRTRISSEQILPADKYYDLEKGKNIVVLDSQLIFSSDGKEVRKQKLGGIYAPPAVLKEHWMVIPLADGQIEIWDTEKEKLLYRVNHPHIPYFIEPDVKNACVYVSGFIDSALYKYDLATGNGSIIHKDNFPVSALAFAKDDFYIGNTNGDVKVAQLKGGRLEIKNRATLFGNGISRITMADDKLLVASYGRMGLIRSDLRDSVNTPLFIGHNGFIRDLAVSPGKRFFISTAGDKTVKLWDLEKNRLVQSYNLDSVNARRLQIISNNEFLFYGFGYLMGGISDSVSVDKFLRPATEIVVQSPNNNSPLKMAIDRDGLLLASVDKNTVKVRDLRSGFLVSEFSTKNKTVNGITFTTDGKMLVVAAGDVVECFDPYSGKTIREILLDKRNRSVHDVEAYNNAIIGINSIGWHNPLILHKNSGLKIGEVWYNSGEKWDQWIRDFKCTPNGSVLATYGSHFLKVFENAESPKNTLTLPLSPEGRSNRNFIDYMNIRADGKYLLYTDVSKIPRVKIIEVAGGKTLKDHEGGIGALGKDGRYIYVVDENRVRFGNIYNDSTRVLDFTCDGMINNIVYNDKTDIFAISDNWGNIKILEGRTGSIIGENSRWDQYTYTAQLSPDGKHILFNNRWGLYTIDLNTLQRETIPAENYPLSGVFSLAPGKLYFRKGQSFYEKNLVSGKIDSLFTTTTDPKEITSLEISDDGKILYYHTQNSDVNFINIETRQPFFTMNRFRVKGWDGFVLRKMIFRDGKYRLHGVGIKNHGKESGLTYIILDAGEQMSFVQISPEIKLQREGDGFEKMVFERDGRLFDVSPDGKYFSYMKNLELYILDVKSGETLFNRDNPVSGNIISGFFTSDSKSFIIGFDDGFTELYDLEKRGKSYAYGNEATGLLRVNRFRANPSGVSLMQMAGTRLLVKGNNAFISLFDAGQDFKKELDMDFIKDQDQVFVSREGYYYSTKNALNYIAFKRDVSIYPFEQMDVKFNRPDKVLEAVRSKDESLVSSYRMAYLKRIKKLNIEENDDPDFTNVPEAEISNRLRIPIDQVTARLDLVIKASDSKYPLEKVNIWVNNVPLWGMKGLSIGNRKKNSLDTTISIQLTKGQNKIETAVTNSNGTESFRAPVMVNYTPQVRITEKVYFVGIGIDRFSESKYNLRYSSKDIRDLAKKLKEKFGDDLVIDTVFNENVTVSHIKALKKKLQQTTVNDKVIISYSGHGLLSKEFDYYLSTYPINFDKPEENGLPYDELESLLDGIPSRKKLLLIDACHSGEVDKDDLIAMEAIPDSLKVKGLKPVAYKKASVLGLKNSFELMQNLFVNVGNSTGAIIISAAAGTQFALEGIDNLPNGVFTYCILEAMNKYPTLKISELKKTVGLKVEELTKGLQKPTSRNEKVAVDWDIW